MNPGLTFPTDKRVSGESRNSRAEAASVVDLHVLISRVRDGETRARAANLPLIESQAATVRGALQAMIEQARKLIAEAVAHNRPVPWIEPPAAAEECESRFVVPLVI